MTPTEGKGGSRGAVGAQGRARKIVAAVARRLYADPFMKMSESVGISPKTLVLWYSFLVLVVGVPAAALFLKRGVPASLHDGEAFLFSLALTLGVLYDHAKASFEKQISPKEAFAEVFRIETLGFVFLNLGALGVSIYYIVTSSDSGAVRGIADGRLAWFCVTVFFAIGLPLVPFLPSALAAGAEPKTEDDSASRSARAAAPTSTTPEAEPGEVRL